MQNATKTLPRRHSFIGVSLVILGVLMIIFSVFIYFARIILWDEATPTILCGLAFIGLGRVIDGIQRLIHELCWLGARVDAGLPFPTSDQPSPPPAPPASAPTTDALTKSP